MHMKNILRNLACLAVLTLLAVSCGSKADYRDVLPANAFMTVSVNPASLLKKSGVEESGQCPLYDRFAPQIEQDGSLTAEEKDYLLGLLKDPSKTGFDFDKDLYYFGTISGTASSPEMGGGLLLPVKDREQLDRLMERINLKSGIEPRSEDGLTLAVISEEAPMRALYAYNDNALLLYCTQNPSLDLTVEAKALFAQSRKTSLMGQTSVGDVLSRKNDLNMVISYSGIASMLDDQSLAFLPARMTEALRNMTAVVSANFEKGRIVMDSKMVYPNAESEAKVRELYAYALPQTGALLPYLPAGSLGVLACGLNGTELFGLLAQMPGYGPLLANAQVKEFMDAIRGDFALAFSGMATASGTDYPLATLLVQVTDPAVLQTLVANLEGMPLRSVGENAYTLEFGGAANRFGVKDGMFYITTDPAVMSALDGNAIESMTSMERLFRGKNSTLYVDMEGVRNLVAQFAPANAETDMGLSLLGLFDDVEIYSTPQDSKCVINMTDKELNALRSICEQVSALVETCTQADE